MQDLTAYVFVFWLCMDGSVLLSGGTQRSLCYVLQLSVPDKHEVVRSVDPGGGDWGSYLFIYLL